MTTPNPATQPGPVPQGVWGPTPPVPPTPGKPTSRRKQRIKYGATAVVALFVGVGIGSGGGEQAAGDTTDAKAGPRPTVTVTATAPGEAAPAPTVTETVTAKPKKAEPAGPATTFSGEGEYLVGEDVKPGTYKTAGAEGEFGCYWERAEDASGEFGSIIANNNLEGPGRVTLNQGEYFKTNRCEEWKRVG
ncbi:hypothetical protein JCM4814A_40470 [Streptomyces phaeofaciens JCM 4814]|uniref:Uncharacterized protein n=1 Tax=Streptomyces phaeofaciens TaxID=68254 RepID=A0A918LUQ2_9ACTN|nr:hypothetical protein [Streptomyces phaeofaciens]GGT52568.1 hypothetical protein GCM10010226_31920 [Streptomyces phaeofaciens]